MPFYGIKLQEKKSFLTSDILSYRTDALLVKLSLLMGKEVFYGALWGSVLVSPSIRLPASLFVVSHIKRELSGKQQKYMLGTDYKLTVSSLCFLWNSLTTITAAC